MNEIINYFLKSVANSTQSLSKKGILVEKPWGMVDQDGKIQKLIFKKNKELILSKNGEVTIGSWDYYPEAYSLLIDRGTDKLLLNEQFIDENLLILKKDGTESQFYALANENTIPDFNVAKYINDLKVKAFSLHKIQLLTGNTFHIYMENSAGYEGSLVEHIDSTGMHIDLPDGKYLSESRELNFYIANKRIQKVTVNRVFKLERNNALEIESGTYPNSKNIGKAVTYNGDLIQKGRFRSEDGYTYYIYEGVLDQITFVRQYLFADGRKIEIEQRKHDSITRGDVIVNASSYPISDGKYKIRGKLMKIKVKNNQII